MEDAIRQISIIDSNSMVLVVIVCSVCAFLMKEALPNPLFALVSYPLMILATLTANAVFRIVDWVPTGDKVQNVMIAAGLGMCVVMLAIAVVARTAYAVTDAVTRKPKAPGEAAE